MTRSTVFAHVHQPFLHNLKELLAHSLRHIELHDVGDETRIDPGLSLKPFHGISQHREQLLGIDINGFHLLHEFA